MKRLEKRLDLGLSVSISRRSRDPFVKGLGLVSVSRNFGGSRSRSRLGLKTKRLGLVSVSKLKVSFTSLVYSSILLRAKRAEIFWHLIYSTRKQTFSGARATDFLDVAPRGRQSTNDCLKCGRPARPARPGAQPDCGPAGRSSQRGGRGRFGPP